MIILRAYAALVKAVNTYLTSELRIKHPYIDHWCRDQDGDAFFHLCITQNFLISAVDELYCRLSKQKQERVLQLLRNPAWIPVLSPSNIQDVTGKYWCICTNTRLEIWEVMDYFIKYTRFPFEVFFVTVSNLEYYKRSESIFPMSLLLRNTISNGAPTATNFARATFLPKKTNVSHSQMRCISQLGRHFFDSRNDFIMPRAHIRHLYNVLQRKITSVAVGPYEALPTLFSNAIFAEQLL